ncbi:MAG: hypothetical protein GY866_16620 [Proteobacteria bacterium]|nr:hypothetical protein [Pseudomonadota bacterium]
MFALKPDFEDVLKRYEAWWDCGIIDRPLVCLTFLKEASEQAPWPVGKNYTTLRERWMDTEYLVESTETVMSNVVYYADSLPIAWPNLGPEIFSAFYGCPMEYGDTTAWSSPILKDWEPSSVEALQLDKSNFYFRKIMEMTDAFIEAGKGKYIVGYTDLHGGADAVAAFRDPQPLCIDLIERPEEVKAFNERITRDFLEIYDIFHHKLSAAGMPSTTWLEATCLGKYHVPSNDFSALISERMFEEFFLPGIVEECRHMDRNIYHLDGPGALRYLDRLLEIPEIHAIQWVPGAGQDYWARWIEVYRRIQQAGKALWVEIPAADLDRFNGLFKPEGVWLNVTDVPDRESAEAVLKKVAGWTA